MREKALSLVVFRLNLFYGLFIHKSFDTHHRCGKILKLNMRINRISFILELLPNFNTDCQFMDQLEVEFKLYIYFKYRVFLEYLGIG